MCFLPFPGCVWVPLASLLANSWCPAKPRSAYLPTSYCSIWGHLQKSVAELWIFQITNFSSFSSIAWTAASVSVASECYLNPCFYWSTWCSSRKGCTPKTPVVVGCDTGWTVPCLSRVVHWAHVWSCLPAALDQEVSCLDCASKCFWESCSSVLENTCHGELPEPVNTSSQGDEQGTFSSFTPRVGWWCHCC